MKRILSIFILTFSFFSITKAQQTDHHNVAYYLLQYSGISPDIKTQLSDGRLQDSTYTDSIVVRHSPSLIVLKTSNLSQLSINKLSMVNGSDLIAIIHSVLAPTPDSQILFFTNQWKPIKTNLLIQLPTTDSFIMNIGNQGIVKDRLRELLTPLHMVFIWQKDGKELEVYPTFTQSLEDQENIALQRAIKKLPHLFYKWNGVSFILDK